ncbi:MAG: hypothetical protein WC666_02840 [Candidatus Paceibacterota bacterium]
MNSYREYKKTGSVAGIRNHPTSSTSSSAVTQQEFEANTEEWKGTSCFDPTKRIDMGILADDIYWYVRLDRDNKRIYPFAPRNHKSGSHIEFGDFNTMECKIAKNQTNADGQIIKTAPAVWMISPARKVASSSN